MICRMLRTQWENCVITSLPLPFARHKKAYLPTCEVRRSRSFFVLPSHVGSCRHSLTPFL